MRKIMFAAIGLAIVGIAISGSLLAAHKTQADKSSKIDILQLTMAAKNLPVVQVNEPF